MLNLCSLKERERNKTLQSFLEHNVEVSIIYTVTVGYF